VAADPLPGEVAVGYVDASVEFERGYGAELDPELDG
jgi:hypothetical protein